MPGGPTEISGSRASVVSQLHYLKAKLGDRNPQTEKARERLAELYTAWSKSDEASKYHNPVLTR